MQTWKVSLRSLGVAIAIWPCLSWADAAKSPQLTVSVSSPSSNSDVDARADVAGTVSDPRAAVWVVVIPDETGECWVEPPVVMDKYGNWSVNAHFGREGKDVGKRFKIKAIANPTGTIVEGKIPCNQVSVASTKAVSNVVNVKRK